MEVWVGRNKHAVLPGRSILNLAREVGRVAVSDIPLGRGTRVVYLCDL